MNFLSKKPVIILIALISLIAGALFSQKFKSPDTVALTQSQTGIRGMLWPNPKTMTEFELTDQDNQPFKLNNLKGQWSMMFFGYTHCPDVCPTTMALLNSIVKEIPPERQPEIIFVSVDPDRDTHEKLKDYITYFNSDFKGITGTEQNLAVLTKQLGILTQKIPDQNSADGSDYIMDHSAAILLFNPNAKMIGIFSSPHDKADIKNRYLAIRDFVEKQ